MEFGIFTAKEYTRFRKSSVDLKKQLPYQPSVFYKKEWAGWNEFTGIKHKSSNIDLQQIQKIAIEMGIKTREEWRMAVATNRIDAPLYVSKVQGFSNWSQFLNVERYVGFDELLNFTRSLNLKTQTDWRKWCRDNERPSSIPFDLQTHYKSDYISANPNSKISFWRFIFVGFK
ncbi:hypothetical protein H5202_20520 [Shewanella sp. SG41-4]|jgi:hypothetical protein|uniref:hypothetical protein n=1 Tax=Shewanella sp. SG41-4 TaxID=2760976 RepID=UPI0016019ACE|nr:hypothetical protein [Shewanella sp. SG41-4]MBB1440996.1 hypothetical protein [Shewanella sp. SG41-4]